MQSIFRLPWCSDPIGSKMAEHASLDKMRPSPVVEIPMLNKLKRKRTVGSDAAPVRPYDCKRSRVDSYAPSQTSLLLARQHAENAADSPRIQPALVIETAVAPPANSAQSTLPLDTASSTTVMEPSLTSTTDAQATAQFLTPVQQIIENEFNMQILMKHNELRLIEQELAKCQVALEQLRRCELRPFPGAHHPSAAVTAGTGPALAPRPGHTRPNHPAPHGVTNGPYSRHYKQWLLQDAQFESVPVQLMQTDAHARPTRNSAPARRPASQTFAFSSRPAPTLSSIPNYPASTSKDRNMPNVLRRSTDGQLVKLICNNCQRGNFSSIQGFLNHCRIAHKVDYKSHDAAAIDCGRLLDEAEVANVPAETVQTPAPKPTVSRTTTAAPTPNRNFVHPFNAAGTTDLPTQTTQPIAARRAAPSIISTVPKTAQAPFNASQQLPRLSAYFAKHNFGGDLASAAADAQHRIDLGVEYDLPSPDISEQNSPLGTPTLSRTIGGNNDYNRAPGNKGVRQHLKPRPSPLAPTTHDNTDMPLSPARSSMSHRDSASDLSPHTADSNPGLVSDHEEDDDHGSASEAEDGAVHHHHHGAAAGGRLPVAGDRTCADGVVIEDDIGEEVVVGRREGVVIRRCSVGSGGKFGVGK